MVSKAIVAFTKLASCKTSAVWDAVCVRLASGSPKNISMKTIEATGQQIRSHTHQTAPWDYLGEFFTKASYISPENCPTAESGVARLPVSIGHQCVPRRR